MEAAQAHLSLHLTKYHIVKNSILRLLWALVRIYAQMPPINAHVDAFNRVEGIISLGPFVLCVCEVVKALKSLRICTVVSGQVLLDDAISTKTSCVCL